MYTSANSHFNIPTSMRTYLYIYTIIFIYIYIKIIIKLPLTIPHSALFEISMSLLDVKEDY